MSIEASLASTKAKRKKQSWIFRKLFSSAPALKKKIQPVIDEAKGKAKASSKE